MIERLFGSRTKVTILRGLSRDPDRDYTVQDISRMLKVPYGSTHPAVMSLIGARLLRSRRVGRTILVRFNSSHILSDQIRSLFRSERNGYMELAKRFAGEVDKKGVKNVILFGSTTREGSIEPGDIDLLIIVNKGRGTNKDRPLIARYLESFDVIISPIYLTEAEVKKKIKMYDGFLLGVLDECRVLFGDDRWLKAL